MYSLLSLGGKGHGMSSSPGLLLRFCLRRIFFGSFLATADGYTSSTPLSGWSACWPHRRPLRGIPMEPQHQGPCSMWKIWTCQLFEANLTWGDRMVYRMSIELWRENVCVCACLNARDFHYACVVLIVIDFDARTCPVGATLCFLHLLTAYR